MVKLSWLARTLHSYIHYVMESPHSLEFWNLTGGQPFAPASLSQLSLEKSATIAKYSFSKVMIGSLPYLGLILFPMGGDPKAFRQLLPSYYRVRCPEGCPRKRICCCTTPTAKSDLHR